MTPFPNALSPLAIGQVTLPNRIVRTAHVTMLGMDARSGVSERLIAYHEARARGGVGLTILEICSGHPSSPAPLMAINPGLVEGYQQLIERIKPHGMRLFQQLWHGGHHAKPLDGSAPWSASNIPSPRLGIASRPMTRSMIAEAIDSHVLAADAARKGGIDGVEIHAAHGYLIQQFLSPITNRRTDDYGGPLEEAEQVIRLGQADCVSMVRATIADPNLVNKTREGRLSANPRFRPFTSSSISKVDARGIEIKTANSGAVTVAAGTAVLVTHDAPNYDFLERAEEKGFECQIVGDARSPRFLESAMREGRFAGMRV